MISRTLKKIMRFSLWGLTGLSALWILIFFFGAVPIGYLAAKYDLMRDHYEIRGYGLRPFLSYEDNIDLFRTHGIECVVVAGCVVNIFIIDNVAAYNAVMREAIKRDFGIDINSNLNQ